MNVETIKQKILKGELTDEELTSLLKLKSISQRSQRSPFLKTIFKAFIDGYAEPHLWRLILELSLIIILVLAVVFLAYLEIIDAVVSVVIFAFVLGFIFGKMK
jgi:hypothetical protein